MPPGAVGEIDLFADHGACQWGPHDDERRSACRALATIVEVASDGLAGSGGSGSRLPVTTLATTFAEALAWAGGRLTDYAERVGGEHQVQALGTLMDQVIACSTALAPLREVRQAA